VRIVYDDLDISIKYCNLSNSFFIFDKDVMIAKESLFDKYNCKYEIINYIKNKLTNECQYCNKLFVSKRFKNFCNRNCKNKYNYDLRRHQKLVIDEKVICLKERIDKCEYCKKKFNDNNTKSADHIIPLSKYKHNNYDNIAIVCKKCNSSKNNKDLIIWANSKGLDLPKHIIKHYYWLMRNI